MIKKHLLCGLLSAAFVGFGATPAHALNDQWYVGIGGTAGWLQPNPDEAGIDLENRLGSGGSLIIGRDLDDRSSLQMQVYSLGEAEIETGETVAYSAVDGSLVYRLYDSRDARISREGMALALYGRFALGYLQRDTDVELGNDSTVYFGAGGGAEVFFNDALSLRLEGLYHDEDAVSATLALVTRFGGTTRLKPAGPSIPVAPEVPSAPAAPAAAPSDSQALPETYQIPKSAEPTPPIATPESASDADADGIINALDSCPDSTLGFPVRSSGCAMFDGVLSGLKFAPGEAELLPSSLVQLDYLANVLLQYPQARIELMAHTDNQGTPRDQAILTRARLRSMGVYLLKQGVSARRLVLRSFGGSRPLYDNNTQEGRNSNNRIEVNEYVQ